MPYGQGHGGGFNTGEIIMALQGATEGILSQQLDIQGSVLARNDLELRHEVDTAGFSGMGRPIASASADGAFSGSSGTQTTLTVATGTPFVAASNGYFIKIEGSTGSNDGFYEIVGYTSSTVVTLDRVDGSSPADESGLDWFYAEPYSLLTDLNYARTDRNQIKGVPAGDHRSDVPVYRRITDITADVNANLYNLSGTGTVSGDTYGVTLDAKGMICPIVFLSEDMSDESGLGDSASNTISATSRLTVVGSPFAAAHVGRVIALSGTTAGADDGDWKITAVNAANDVTLRAVDSAGTLTTDDTGSVTWTMYSDRRFVDISTKHADDVDRSGIPISDGATADQTKYDATHVLTLSAGDREGFVSNAGDGVWGRTFKGVSGTDVLVRFFTGTNDATATAHNWESGGEPGDADPTSIYLQVPNRYRMDQLPETCLVGALVGGTFSDAELVEDISNLWQALGLNDSENRFQAGDITNYSADYPINPTDVPELIGINMFDALNESIGSRDYNTDLETLGATDGDDITTVLNLLATAIADFSIERFQYKATADVNRHDDLLISAFPGTTTPDDYYTLGTGAFAWLFVRGELMHVGTSPQTGLCSEVDAGGGKGSGWTMYTKIRTGDYVSYMKMK